MAASDLFEEFERLSLQHQAIQQQESKQLEVLIEEIDDNKQNIKSLINCEFINKLIQWITYHDISGNRDTRKEKSLNIFNKITDKELEAVEIHIHNNLISELLKLTSSSNYEYQLFSIEILRNLITKNSKLRDHLLSHGFLDKLDAVFHPKNVCIHLSIIQAASEALTNIIREEHPIFS